DGAIRAILQQADGKLLVGGEFGAFNSIARRGVLRLNGDGSLDTSFDADLPNDAMIATLCEAVGGKLWVSGFSATNNDWGYVFRLNPNGTRDTSFVPPPVPIRIRTMAANTNRLYLGGVVTGNGDCMAVIRALHLDGTLDAAFQPALD